MKKQPFAVLFIAITVFAALFLPAFAAQASPVEPQVAVATPTALPDGRIVYLVQPGDTCIGISLRMGISIEQIILLNDMRGGECTPIAGSELLLGTVAPTATPNGPTATPTPVVPEGTPFAGSGEVCIQLFNDLNGNAMLEEGEGAITGGAVSLSDRVGKVSETGNTGAEPTCFTELPEGEYAISMAVPEGYNPTTRTSYSLNVRAGDQSLLDFGAQVSSAAQPLPVSEGGRSPMLGLIGAVVLIAGVGMAVYARVVLRR